MTIHLHPPFTLQGSGKEMIVSGYIAPKPNRMHYPFTEEWQWDAAIKGWGTSKVTVKVQEESIRQIIKLVEKFYIKSPYFLTDYMVRCSLEKGLYITFLQGSLEFYKVGSKDDLIGEWFVRLLPAEQPNKSTAICPTCGYLREISTNGESGCFIPPDKVIV